MNAAFVEWTDDTILAKIEDVHGMETELPVKITLYQGLPKGDKMEMIVQKAVELGRGRDRSNCHETLCCET